MNNLASILDDYASGVSTREEAINDLLKARRFTNRLFFLAGIAAGFILFTLIHSA
jgi:hypothetical protein